MERKECPYCGEMIAASAKKCRFCGEWLDQPDPAGRLGYVANTPDESSTQQSVQPQVQQAQPEVQQNAPQQIQDVNVPQQTQSVSQAAQTIELESEEDDTQQFMVKYFVNPYIRNYAQFKGRTSRSDFWLTMLAFAVISCGVAGLGAVIGGFCEGVIGALLGCCLGSTIMSIAFLVPNLAIMVRRLNDSGQSWHKMLFTFIPFVGPIILLLALCKEPIDEESQTSSATVSEVDVFAGIACVLLFVAGLLVASGVISIGDNDSFPSPTESLFSKSSDSNDIFSDGADVESNELTENETANTNQSIRLSGRVGNYRIVMEIESIQGSTVQGYYRYTSSGSGEWIRLRGNLYQDRMYRLCLKEYLSDGRINCEFDGDLNVDNDGTILSYNGIFSTPDGKEYEFELE